MKSISKLEEMANSLFDKHSEFRKFDRIDGLLCLNLIERKESWTVITCVVSYLSRDYKLKDIEIDSQKLIKELQESGEYLEQIDASEIKNVT
jgi:hypothetical protein